jgi:hypothetical protein
VDEASGSLVESRVNYAYSCASKNAVESHMQKSPEQHRSEDDPHPQRDRDRYCEQKIFHPRRHQFLQLRGSDLFYQPNASILGKLSLTVSRP